jgi:UDP-GlcNAc:undecaprenyl-phosphate/decaprenyl-phosphate GlcNAc-1-phosphate transferase
MFDNHDGSASGVSLLILLFILFLSIKSNQTLVLTMSSILIAATLPFLFWNLPPARIYLGDSGATFLGTSIGVLLISIDFTTLSPLNAILASFCLIGILVLDFSVAVLSRLRRGISPMIGDKAHTAHRLIRLSLSKNKTTLVIWFITIWFGFHGIRATFTSGLELQLIFTSACLSYLALTYLFLRQPDE